MNDTNLSANLLETLAELEHDQWLHWSKAVAPEVSPETRERWTRFSVPYADLPDNIKEFDRIWARKIIALLRAKDLLRV